MNINAEFIWKFQQELFEFTLLFLILIAISCCTSTHKDPNLVKKGIAVLCAKPSGGAVILRIDELAMHAMNIETPEIEISPGYHSLLVKYRANTSWGTVLSGEPIELQFKAKKGYRYKVFGWSNKSLEGWNAVVKEVNCCD